MRPHAAKIATTGRDVTINIEIMDRGATIEIMDQGLIAGTTGRGLATLQGLTILTTSKSVTSARSHSSCSASMVGKAQRLCTRQLLTHAVDLLNEHVRLSEIEQQLVCKACGKPVLMSGRRSNTLR